MATVKYLQARVAAGCGLYFVLFVVPKTVNKLHFVANALQAKA
jgi:hypothetical protein